MAQITTNCAFCLNKVIVICVCVCVCVCVCARVCPSLSVLARLGVEALCVRAYVRVYTYVFVCSRAHNRKRRVNCLPSYVCTSVFVSKYGSNCLHPKGLGIDGHKRFVEGT